MPNLLAFALSLAFSTAPNAVAPGPGCSFHAGTRTCVTVTQSPGTDQITMVSGCLYGPQGIPGRRERVFEETLLITATTTTLAHGLNGPVYDSSTTVTRQVVSSRQISDTCYPP